MLLLIIKMINYKLNHQKIIYIIIYIPIKKILKKINVKKIFLWEIHSIIKILAINRIRLYRKKTKIKLIISIKMMINFITLIMIIKTIILKNFDLFFLIFNQLQYLMNIFYIIFISILLFFYHIHLLILYEFI
jgi:hypothetical protein